MEKFEISLEFFDLAKILSEQKQENIAIDYEEVKTRISEEIWNAKLDSLSELKAKLKYTQDKLEEMQEQIAKIKNKKKLAAIKKSIKATEVAISQIKAEIDQLDMDIENTNSGKRTNKKDINYSINLRINRDEVFEYYEIVKKIYSLLRDLEDKAVVNIEIYEALREQETTAPVNYTYTIEQFNDLVELYNHMNGYKVAEGHEYGDILFTDDVNDRNENKLSLGDVYFINKRIDNIVDFIKQKQFTPYEAMLYIHNYLTALEYNDTESCIAQMITGPLLGQEIVCSGYASLTKAIVDKLNMPGLKCELQGFNYVNANKSAYADSSHAACLIHIKDEKYDIDGSYYDDISSDSVIYYDVFDKGSEESELLGDLITMSDDGRFTYFLYPQCDSMLFIDNGKHNYMVRDRALTRYEQIIYIDTEDKDLKKDIEEIDYLEKVILPDRSLINDILKAKNKPIPVETLIKGLYYVIQSGTGIIEEYGMDTVKETIYAIIMPSMERALDVYSRHAQNDLLQSWYDYGYFKRKDKKRCISDAERSMLLKITNMVSELEQKHAKNNIRRG